MSVCVCEQVLQRDESIKQLQEDLLESQTQYSACYNEVRTGLKSSYAKHCMARWGTGDCTVMAPNAGLKCFRTGPCFVRGLALRLVGSHRKT